MSKKKHASKSTPTKQEPVETLLDPLVLFVGRIANAVSNPLEWPLTQDEQVRFIKVVTRDAYDLSKQSWFTKRLKEASERQLNYNQ